METTGGTEIEHEYVRCNLCGKDDARTKFAIRTRETRHSSVWVNDTQCLVDLEEIVVACRQCGLVYVNPRPVSDPGIAAYSADQESAYFWGTREGRLAAYEDLVLRIPAWLGRNAQTLLDIGCGDGVLLEVAGQAGIRCVGSEVSDELIHLGQKRLGADAVVSGNLARLPDAHYDVITLINVLEHLGDPYQMLNTCARLLRTGGILLVHVPNLGGVPARLRGVRWHHIEPLEHLYYFTACTLEALLRKAELEPIGRFNLLTSTGLRSAIQRALGKAHVHLDNGLGIVARSSPRGKKQ